MWNSRVGPCRQQDESHHRSSRRFVRSNHQLSLFPDRWKKRNSLDCVCLCVCVCVCVCVCGLRKGNICDDQWRMVAHGAHDDFNDHSSAHTALSFNNAASWMLKSQIPSLQVFSFLTMSHRNSDLVWLIFYKFPGILLDQQLSRDTPEFRIPAFKFRNISLPFLSVIVYLTWM